MMEALYDWHESLFQMDLFTPLDKVSEPILGEAMHWTQRTNYVHLSPISYIWEDISQACWLECYDQ